MNNSSNDLESDLEEELLNTNITYSSPPEHSKKQIIPSQIPSHPTTNTNNMKNTIKINKIIPSKTFVEQNAQKESPPKKNSKLSTLPHQNKMLSTPKQNSSGQSQDSSVATKSNPPKIFIKHQDPSSKKIFSISLANKKDDPSTNTTQSKREKQEKKFKNQNAFSQKNSPKKNKIEEENNSIFPFLLENENTHSEQNKKSSSSESIMMRGEESAHNNTTLPKKNPKSNPLQSYFFSESFDLQKQKELMSTSPTETSKKKISNSFFSFPKSFSNNTSNLHANTTQPSNPFNHSPTNNSFLYPINNPHFQQNPKKQTYEDLDSQFMNFENSKPPNNPFLSPTHHLFPPENNSPNKILFQNPNLTFPNNYSPREIFQPNLPSNPHNPILNNNGNNFPNFNLSSNPILYPKPKTENLNFFGNNTNNTPNFNVFPNNNPLFKSNENNDQESKKNSLFPSFSPFIRDQNNDKKN